MKSPATPNNLLAINFGGLGDEVLFLPTLQTIRKHYPAARITLLTEPRGSGIRQISDIIDDNLVFDIKKRPLRPADYLQLIALLRGGGYDTVVSSGSSPQVAGLLFLSGIPRRVGYASNRLAKLLLTDPVPLNRRQHASMMYHDLTVGLGIDDRCPPPKVQASAAALEKMQQQLNEQGTASGGKKQVLIHPGTSLLAIQKRVYKTWSPSHWAQLTIDLIEKQGCRVILAGGPDDAQTIASIESALSERHPGLLEAPQKLFRAFGKTANLQDLLALMALSDLIVCVDSAPMHLAVALDKPLVALFGPTDPAKLLWPGDKFCALRNAQDAQLWADRDPFTQPLECSPPGCQPEPYVQIQPDIVFRTVADRLHPA